MLRGYLSSSIALSISRGVAQFCSLLLIFAATRVLQPADFGIFTIASAIGVLLWWLAEAGWKEFVISHQSNENAPSVAMWFALATGLAGTTIAMAACLVAMRILPTSRIPPVIMILSTMAPLMGWIAVQNAVLIRRGLLKRLALTTIVSEVCGLVVGLITLVRGSGIFSLAFARITQCMIAALGLTLASRWLPRAVFDSRMVGGLGRYWRALIVTRLFDYTKAYGVELCIGLFLGAASVGVYRLGSRILASISELVTEPVRTLVWSDLARVNDSDGNGPGRASMWLQRIYIVTTPAFVGLALIANDLVATLFDPEWKNAGPVLCILSLTTALGAPIAIGAAPILRIAHHLRIPDATKLHETTRR